MQVAASSCFTCTTVYIRATQLADRGPNPDLKKVITCLAAEDQTIFLYVLVMTVSFLSLQINNSTGLDLRKY